MKRENRPYRIFQCLALAFAAQLAVLLGLGPLYGAVEKQPARLFFAGDSTLDDYGLSLWGKMHCPYQSWGTTLQESMVDGCAVRNATAKCWSM